MCVHGYIYIYTRNLYYIVINEYRYTMNFIVYRLMAGLNLLHLGVPKFYSAGVLTEAWRI